MLEARGIQSALFGGRAVSLRGLVAAQRDVIDWSACLELAEKLGEAVDLDIVSRLRAARADHP
jgi:hypothetical protein